MNTSSGRIDAWTASWEIWIINWFLEVILIKKANNGSETRRPDNTSSLNYLEKWQVELSSAVS